MSPDQSTLVVLGAGPGLGLSMARRFGRQGYRIGLVARRDDRLREFAGRLTDDGITTRTVAADVQDTESLRAALTQLRDGLGPVDVLYYGPADTSVRPTPITTITPADVASAMTFVYPAVNAVAEVLPSMLDRSTGGLLFAGGLSAVQPMPGSGALALMSAALRNYAITLHAALRDRGVFAASLTIGGLIERGDIHRMVTEVADHTAPLPTLDPDRIADAAWHLYKNRTEPEQVFSALPTPTT